MSTADLARRARARRQRQEGYACRVLCCGSTPCRSCGCDEVHAALLDATRAHGLEDRVVVVATGCMGMCSRGPLVRLEPAEGEPVLFQQLEPLVARLLVAEFIHPLLDGRLAPGAVPAFLSDFVLATDLPFFTRQERVVLANCGVVDPAELDDALAHDAYRALQAVLADGDPAAVVQAVHASGLRGRGGGSYPTGAKWAAVRAAPGEDKHVICNADEGDPGAYMDRCILEGDPHTVIEGLAIAGYAVGAAHGWFYIRSEYPEAVARLAHALDQARAAGVLGADVLGSGWSFDCEIRLSAGAFVCGEETALIASLEGRRGTPRSRPPYPSARGLWRQPSCINNVETLANIPAIIRRGAAWFAGLGSADSPGTKVFTLTGRCRYSGLIEVPMGIPLRTIVEEIGGGSGNGRALRAVQTGGLSGGLIPADAFDLPVSDQEFHRVGSIVGSGGMIVLDEADDLLDLAAFYLEFAVEESCGKCAACRIGTTQLLDLVRRVQRGTAGETELVLIERLCQAMRRGALCGLGRAAPEPVLAVLRHDRAGIDRRLVGAGGAS